MRVKIHIAIVLAGMTQLCFSDEPVFRVTTEKLAPQENAIPDTNKPNAEFCIRFVQANEKIPDLTIPTYSSEGPRYGGTRVADARLSKDRMEVALQFDEFLISYSDYRLVDGKWVERSRKRICALNGPRALTLAQVDILEGSVVEVKYSNVAVGSGQDGWENALINKINQYEENVQTERYVQQGENFVFVGKPFNPDLRFKDNVPQQNVEKSPTADGLENTEQQGQQQSHSPMPAPASTTPSNEPSENATPQEPQGKSGSTVYWICGALAALLAALFWRFYHQRESA